MKDNLPSLIIVNTVTKNITGSEVCALSAAVIHQLKRGLLEDCVKIYILGKDIYNDTLKKRIECMISVNYDIKNLDITISQINYTQTSIECIEYLIQNIHPDSFAKACLMCLGRELIKTKLIWYFEQRDMSQEKKWQNIKILTTPNQTPSKNKLYEFIEIIKVVLHFCINKNFNKRFKENNTSLIKEVFNTTEEDTRLETIIKTHQKL